MPNISSSFPILSTRWLALLAPLVEGRLYTWEPQGSLGVPLARWPVAGNIHVVGPRAALKKSLPASRQRACHSSEKEVSGLKAARLAGCLLPKHNLTCPDRCSEPVQTAVLSESLGAPLNALGISATSDASKPNKTKNFPFRKSGCILSFPFPSHWEAQQGLGGTALTQLAPWRNQHAPGPPLK